MLKRFAAAITMMTALTIGSLPIQAQSNSPQTPSDPTVILNLNRAQNLARQAAEKANGGLGNYRAESSMYGPGSLSPYVLNGDGTITFTFKGRRPEETTPTMETVVTVAQDASNVAVDYNGAIRTSQ